MGELIRRCFYKLIRLVVDRQVAKSTVSVGASVDSSIKYRCRPSCPYRLISKFVTGNAYHPCAWPANLSFSEILISLG